MISVLIPAYNAENSISKSLDSVFAQTYKDIEVIVVNDGSKDNTLKVLNEYAQKEPGLTVLHQENSGVSIARNLAVSKAQGEYIFFLDADDILEKDALEILLRSMESEGCDWVSCQYSRWDEEGNRLKDFEFNTGIRSFKNDEERARFATEEFLIYKVGYEVWDKLYRRDVIIGNNILFSPKCRIGEDLSFNLKYLSCAKKLNMISDRCVRYLISENSTMGNLKDYATKVNENILLLEDYYDYIDKNSHEGLKDAFILYVLRIMDSCYVTHTPKEASEALSKSPERPFLKQAYRGLNRKKDDIITMYGDNIGFPKYRYHMYVYLKMTNGRFYDKILSFAYDSYRRLKKRMPICDWEMPY